MQTLINLVGPVRPSDLAFVESYVSHEAALFMPCGGACGYAVLPGHAHPAYMFVLAFDDNTRVELGGRVYGLKAGEVMALAPGVKHRELPAETPPRYVAAMIAPGLFEAVFARYGAVLPDLGDWTTFVADGALKESFARFMQEAEQANEGDLLSALAREIAHRLARGLLGVKMAPSPVRTRLEIGRALEFLHRNLGQKITVGQLAAQAGFSPAHFARLFRQETGLSAAAYLLRARLEQARRRLRSGESVTEAAAECGFASPAHFSAAFRRAFKEPPSRYAARLDD